SFERRAGDVRRILDERAGRGCCGWGSHSRSDLRAAEAEPGHLQAVPRHYVDAGAALPGHAGRGIHDRAWPAVHAAVSRWEAVGKVVFDADTAAARGHHGGAGEAVLLVREETNPDDVHGMLASQGVLTARGGKTSHAAVVARGFGIPCVAGAESIHVDERAK